MNAIFWWEVRPRQPFGNRLAEPAESSTALTATPGVAPWRASFAANPSGFVESPPEEHKSAAISGNRHQSLAATTFVTARHFGVLQAKIVDKPKLE